MNAVEIEEAVSNLASQPFDREAFPFSFLEAYGNKETTIKRLQSGNSNKSTIAGGVLQRSNIHLATCDEGQVTATLQQLSDAPETTKQKAKFILATDGEEIQAEDLTSGDTLACAFADLDQHFTFFFELAGISTVKEIRESAFDIKATSRLNKLYLELLRHNPDWATAERRTEMNHFMARLIFCFFAEDTNILRGDNLFTGTVEKISDPDGSNVHEIIAECFRSMDTHFTEKDKADIRVWARSFPYVNGELFSGSRECPRFSRIARTYLLHVGKLDWQQINPDIFGSMIQAVADEDERSSLGMHYTSVPNILKVLNPLFLDELHEQLEAAGDNSRKLANLRRRIARIRVFDPACGSGNFLVIAYKQLREIEYEINQRRGEADRKSEIPLTNFRGIELKHFSAEIARLALIIAEYQCDVLYLGVKAALDVFLPLDNQNWITCGNALRLNWLTVCPPSGEKVEVSGTDLFGADAGAAEVRFENDGGETFICGNPPYLGFTWQTKEQKSDLESIFKKYTKTWKSLDYVAGWIMKAAEYGTHTKTVAAFVTTNSICQGQQVPMLWPLIFGTGHEIAFAHTSFKWANLASHNAGVTVIIVGISSESSARKFILSEERNGNTSKKETNYINAYLVPGTKVIVSTMSKPTGDKSVMEWGNKPTDGGNLFLDENEKTELLKASPEALKFVKRFMGAQEFIKGLQRYCIWIKDEDRREAESIARLKKRIDDVAKMRLASKAASTRKSAVFPHRFRQIQSVAKGYSLVVARVSSEGRDYLPIGLESKHVIIGDRNFALYDAPLWNLAIIASRLHWVWIGTVCVRMRTDFSYSNTLGWNTFPLPPLTTKNKADLTRCAEDILLARERHFPATIADLYAPDKMPEDLKRAHDRNDEVLERIYIGRRFKNDTERLEKLFELYTEMTAKGT
ncbi:class I SAM-dependent DNA methyltransferase [Neolewinella agarilytica]|uniref:class I SAM-dependent DNA methyltransferase n=1 Tax=Neolewinella agarilytica TaxID=478744 RepID=UPI0023539C95|nr:DNA methyltransferase [Neolewinella agarilytica]